MPDQQFNTEEVYDRLRCAILDRLRQEIDRKGRSLRSHPTVIGSAEVKSLLPDYPMLPRYEEQIGLLICQIYHELYLERLIIPGTGSLTSTGTMEWPWFQVTEHGQQVLRTSEYSPFDPNGYLRRLKSEVPCVDQAIVRYVEESLKSLQTDCLLAATVTIGCASEKAMLLLIEQFGQAITDTAKRKAYEKDTSHWIISRKYEAFRKRLDRIIDQLPYELRDPLEQQLHGVFDLIRRIRNDAGHPTGGTIARESVLASHLLFPGYCKYVYSLMDHFAKNAPSL